MGQRIEVVKATVMDEILMIDTDRSITGQDGVTYPSRSDAEADGTFPGQLATRLFGSDTAIAHVFVGSNGVVIKRPAGWDDATLGSAFQLVQDFFLYYQPAG